MNFYFIARWKERVEPDNEFWMTSEETGDSGNYSRGVNALALELLHDV